MEAKSVSMDNQLTASTTGPKHSLLGYFHTKFKNSCLTFFLINVIHSNAVENESLTSNRCFINEAAVHDNDCPISRTVRYCPLFSITAAQLAALLLT